MIKKEIKMRFYTVKQEHQLTIFISLDGGQTAYPAPGLGLNFDDLNALIKNFKPQLVDQIKAAVSPNGSGTNGLLTPLPLKDLVLAAPIVHPLQDVICLGINYDQHAKEAGKFSREAFGGERPYTIYFSKRVNEATAPKGTIPSYTGLVDSLDYEAELGVVLGRDAKALKPEEVQNYIFGYLVINDVSARNLQTRHKQWYLGKSLDGFTPMGPGIVTPDEIPDLYNLKISSRVNGELRQNSNTGFMIQKVEGAVSELSQGMTLKAGTIIAMGTPAGVGLGFKPPKFLKPGDVVTCEIAGIGKLENQISR